MIYRRAKSLDEAGIIAIVVSVIVLTVISMTVIGFAQLARREQQQALDKQLGVEANYAAESGINDAIYALSHNYGSGPAQLPKTNCDDSSNTFSNTLSGYLDTYAFDTGTPSLATGVMDFSPTIITLLTNGLGGAGAGRFEYTCLLIDDHPKELKHDVVTADGNTRDDITAVDASGKPTPISELEINWQAVDGANNKSFLGNLPNFPAADSWGKSPSLLQADITKLSRFSRVAFIKNTMTAFLYPKNGGGITSVPFSANPKTTNGQIYNGQIYGAGCTKKPALAPMPYYCTARIQIGGASHVFLRLKSLYSSSEVQIRALESDSPLNIKGSQVVIDSTGKVSNVLKRIQVHGDLTPAAKYPAFAVQSESTLCKRLLVGSDVFADYGSFVTDPGDKVICGTQKTPDEGDTQFVPYCQLPAHRDSLECHNHGPIKDPYNKRFINTSVNDTSKVTRCTWNWGYSTPDGGGAADNKQTGGTACLSGQEIAHKFPSHAGNKCVSFTVTLTIYFTNGSFRPYTLTVKMPIGCTG